MTLIRKYIYDIDVNLSVNVTQIEQQPTHPTKKKKKPWQCLSFLWDVPPYENQVFPEVTFKECYSLPYQRIPRKALVTSKRLAFQICQSNPGNLLFLGYRGKVKMKIGFGELQPFRVQVENSSAVRGGSGPGKKQLSREMTCDHFID